MLRAMLRGRLSLREYPEITLTKMLRPCRAIRSADRPPIARALNLRLLSLPPHPTPHPTPCLAHENFELPRSRAVD